MKLILRILFVALVLDIAVVLIQYDNYKKFWNANHCYDIYHAAVIFFGDYDDDKNEIGDMQKKRLGYALDLYSQGRFKYFILVGGNRVDGSLKGSELSSLYLQENGIKEDIIFYDDKSYDTKTNWIEAEKIINNKRFSSILCISSPYHIYRIAKIIDKEHYCYDAYPQELKSPVDYFTSWVSINRELFVFTLYSIMPEDWYLKALKYYRDKKHSDDNKEQANLSLCIPGDINSNYLI